MAIQDAVEQLHNIFGERFSRADPVLAQHGQSETHFPLTPPDGVVWPETTDDVALIMRICAEHACPVVGWGAGTSLEGHALAVRGGICVDFARMDAVLEVNAGDMDVRVQPGITREALNTALRDTGLFFPVDPGANASIGGMAMTRASGTTAVRYGTMRDNVMGLEVVMADGRVIRTGGRARKSSAGYDLTGLFVGSEGTLGLVTELTLRLHGQPAAVMAAVCAFGDMAGAVAAVTETIQCGVPMARIEFVDAATVRAVNAAGGTAFAEQPHLMVEFHGSDTAVAEDSAIFQAIAQEHGGQGFEQASRTEDRSRLWKVRHEAYWSILASRPGATAIVTDVCVPLSALAQAVRETEAEIEASPLNGPILGHVGDGNFHAILLVEPGDPFEMKVATELADRMAERALKLGGTITGEHGIGMGKLNKMAAEHGLAWEVMGQIKRALDPEGLINPGKVVRQN